MNLVDQTKNTFGEGSPQHVEALALELGDIAKGLASAERRVFSRRLFGFLPPTPESIQAASSFLQSLLDGIVETRNAMPSSLSSPLLKTLGTFADTLERSCTELLAVSECLHAQLEAGSQGNTDEFRRLVDKYRAADAKRVKCGHTLNSQLGLRR